MRNNQHNKKVWVRRLRSIMLMLFACFLVINSSMLSTQTLRAIEPKKAALELTVEGKKLYELGKFDAAAKVWEEAAQLYAEMGDEPNKNQSLINVAEALQANGRYLKACDVAIEIVEIEQFNCRNSTENQDSDLAFQKWFDNFPVQSATLTQANGLHSFGDILQKLGFLDLSNKVLQKSLQVARHLSSPQTEGAILLSLGNNQQLKGDRGQNLALNLPPQDNLPLTCPVKANRDISPHYQKTLGLYEQAAERFISPNAEIKVQLNRLILLLKMGAKSEALALTRQILPKLEELPTESNTIYLRLNLAKSLVCLSPNVASTEFPQSESVKILTTAVTQAQNLGDRRSESYALGYLGWLYEQDRQITKALSFTREALLIAQAIQANEIAYKWQWQLGYLLETQGNTADAIAAYSDAVKLLQLLRRDLVGIQTETQFYFQEQVEPVYRQLVKLLLQNQNDSSIEQNNLRQARQTIESLKLLELENYLQKACLNPKIEIDRIIDREDSKTAVIYPIILEQQLAIILKLPRQKELRYYTTDIAQDRLVDTVSNLESYLSDVTRTAQVNQFSAQIYSWLISPLENDLKNSNVDTLVFVPDSFLGNVPMSVLYDLDKQQYLIEQYAISLAPSLQLVDSNPIGNFPIEILAGGISQQRRIKGREFASLVNVRQELSQIQSEITNSTELLDSKFTKINLQKQLRNKSFSVIHLATHSQFSSSLDRTFILVWEQLLRIEDMVNLFQVNYSQDFNPIELLVLSACQTAKGDRFASLGLAGITVRAGVNTTLATLWSVDDFSTTKIMDRFYQELNNGVTIAKAVQKAQLEFLEREKRPYFWAPFVLVGNWL